MARKPTFEKAVVRLLGWSHDGGMLGPRAED
jgi:hypothetical protein